MSKNRESRKRLWRSMRRLHMKSAELSKVLPAAVEPAATVEDPTVAALRKMVRMGRAYHMVVR